MEYKEFRIRIANRVKEERAKKGLTQEAMSEGKFSVPWRTVQDIENLEGDIRLTTLFRIAKRLDISVKDLVDV